MYVSALDHIGLQMALTEVEVRLDALCKHSQSQSIQTETLI